MVISEIIINHWDIKQLTILEIQLVKIISNTSFKKICNFSLHYCFIPPFIAVVDVCPLFSLCSKINSIKSTYTVEKNVNSLESKT